MRDLHQRFFYFYISEAPITAQYLTPFFHSGYYRHVISASGITCCLGFAV
jgi:hypothetical protein